MSQNTNKPPTIAALMATMKTEGNSKSSIRQSGPVLLAYTPEQGEGLLYLSYPCCSRGKQLPSSPLLLPQLHLRKVQSAYVSDLTAMTLNRHDRTTAICLKDRVQLGTVLPHLPQSSCAGHRAALLFCLADKGRKAQR